MSTQKIFIPPYPELPQDPTQIGTITSQDIDTGSVVLTFGKRYYLPPKIWSATYWEGVGLERLYVRIRDNQRAIYGMKCYATHARFAITQQEFIESTWPRPQQGLTFGPENQGKFAAVCTPKFDFDRGAFINFLLQQVEKGTRYDVGDLVDFLVSQKLLGLLSKKVKIAGRAQRYICSNLGAHAFEEATVEETFVPLGADNVRPAYYENHPDQFSVKYGVIR